MATGTLSLTDLLQNKQTTVLEFGLDRIQPVLQADIDAHNRIVADMTGALCETTADRYRLNGTSVSGDMVEADEFTRAPTQKPSLGANVGFPLKLFQFALGWTEKWMAIHTPADMAAAVLNAEKAHLKQLQRQIKKAIFASSNYSFTDRLVAPVAAIPVKRFVNADGDPIADGPNGETFDGSTETHYLGTGSLAQSDVLALIEDVVEHGHGNQVKVFINRAQESSVRGFTDFYPYIDPRLVRGTEADKAAGTLDITRIDDRAIGVLGAAEIWVKPWVPASYMFCADIGDERKPLALRVRPGRDAGLRIAAELSAFPLHAQYMEAEFGVGVATRTNGACLYTANATWADASIS